MLWLSLLTTTVCHISLPQSCTCCILFMWLTRALLYCFSIRSDMYTFNNWCASIFDAAQLGPNYALVNHPFYLLVESITWQCTDACLLFISVSTLLIIVYKSIFLIHLKLELLRQVPPSNDGKYAHLWKIHIYHKLNNFMNWSFYCKQFDQVG